MLLKKRKKVGTAGRKVVAGTLVLITLENGVYGYKQSSVLPSLE